MNKLTRAKRTLPAAAKLRNWAHGKYPDGEPTYETLVRDAAKAMRSAGFGMTIRELRKLIPKTLPAPKPMNMLIALMWDHTANKSTLWVLNLSGDLNT